MTKWKNIQVPAELHSELKELYENDAKRPKNQKFNGYMVNILSVLVDHHKKLQQYGPFLEFKDAVDNQINMFDHSLREPIVVWIDGQKKQLKCGKDRRDDCVHVGFAFAQPEVYDTLVTRHGFRPPKKLN